MVSLIDRSPYLQNLVTNEKTRIFYEFLYSQANLKFQDDTDLIAADKIFLNVLISLRNNDEKLFFENYNEISKRSPSAESSSLPFINDDFLIFSLIVGVFKFNGNRDWLISVLEKRKCSNEECTRMLTTYRNILAENYISQENHFGMILVFQNLILQDILSGKEKSHYYQLISSSIFPHFKSEFLNLIELKSFDLLNSESLISADSDFNASKRKLGLVNKRIEQISITLYLILWGIVIGVVIWLYRTNETIKNVIQDYEAIFGFVGFGGIMGIMFAKKTVVNFLNRCLTIFFLGARK